LEPLSDGNQEIPLRGRDPDPRTRPGETPNPAPNPAPYPTERRPAPATASETITEGPTDPSKKLNAAGDQVYIIAESLSDQKTQYTTNKDYTQINDAHHDAWENFP
jgi:hypothetical protein